MRTALLLVFCILALGSAAAGQTVRVIHLRTNDIYYDPVGGMLWATVPGNSHGVGAGIASIDVPTGRVGPVIPVGAGPTRIVGSEDGKYLYVGLNGEFAVRRFDLATGQPGIKIGLGTDAGGHPLVAEDLAVVPSRSTSVVVSLATGYVSPQDYSYQNYGLAVYDSHLQRGSTVLASSAAAFDYLVFGGDPSTLYASGIAGMQRLLLDSSGLTEEGVVGENLGAVVRGSDGLYYGGGAEADIDGGTLRGAFRGGPVAYSPVVGVAPDGAAGRAYNLLETFDGGGSGLVIAAYDTTTFRPMGSLEMSPGKLTYLDQTYNSRLLLCGPDYMAFRTPAHVVIIRGRDLPSIKSLSASPNSVAGGGTTTITVTLDHPAPPGGIAVNLSASPSGWIQPPGLIHVPVGSSSASIQYTTRTVPATQRAVLTATYGSDIARTDLSVLDAAGDPAISPGVTPVRLDANDLAYDSLTNRIYASVPSEDGSLGNSVVPITPSTGAIGQPIHVGSEPGALALSSDGEKLYTALGGAGRIERLDVRTRSVDLDFPVGSPAYFADDSAAQMAVLPGSNIALAASRLSVYGSPAPSGIVVYDSGAPRPNVYPLGTDFFGDSGAPYAITAGADAAHLYGNEYLPSGTPTFIYDRFSVDATGVSLIAATNDLITDQTIRYAAGSIYSGRGLVAGADTGLLEGTFIYPGWGASSCVLPDLEDGVVIFGSADYNGNTALYAFDPATYILRYSLTLSGAFGSPTSMVRTGRNRIAFLTPGQVVLVDLDAARVGQ